MRKSSDVSFEGRVVLAYATMLGLLAGATLPARSRAQERSVPARERSVQVDTGVTLSVVDLGRSTGEPALVLIPGWGTSADIWREQAERFSARRRVIVVDPRSQGASTITAEGLTPEQRARDLHQVIARLGVGSAVLVGWSQGVQDVAAYVQAFGTDSLAGVILVDAAISAGAGGVGKDPRAATQFFERMSIYVAHPEAYARGMLTAIIAHPLAPERLEELADDLLRTPTSLGVAMLVADLYGVDRTPAIPKFEKPTLVIASSKSPELDAQRAMAAAMPKGRIEVLSDAGHAVFVDQPERFTEVVERFLAALSAQAAGSGL